MVSPTEKITFQNAPSPQEFNEGDDADIICDIISSPPPTIVWKYKGFTIQFSKDGELPQTAFLFGKGRNWEGK